MLDAVWFQCLIFIGGLVMLIMGSDMFVSKAERIGLSLGVSPFIIGVTVVALGTSLPELGSSIAAVVEGSSQIVVGNVVGSNISNILFVLGLVAVIAREINFHPNVFRFDMFVLIGATFLLFFVLRDGELSLVEGILFMVGLALFIYNTIRNREDVVSERSSASWVDYVLLLMAGGMIFFGAEYTVKSISFLAGEFGIDESFIAITMLALGTSLPEVSVSAAAAKRGNVDMAIGNIIGSNIFNTFGVMAISSFFGKLIIPPEILSFGLPFMIGVTALFYVACISKKLDLWSGVLLLCFYAFFIYELAKDII